MKWLGRFVGLAPAGGKSNLYESAPDAVVDVECAVAWPDLRRELCAGQPDDANWEDSTDTVSLFFRGAVPVIMAALVLGRTAVAHCIDHKSSWMAGLFLSGIPSTVARLDDDVELERRVAARNAVRPNSPGRGIEWYHACHTTWLGLAARFGIPVVPVDQVRPTDSKDRLTDAERRLHVCRFRADGRAWALIEVLPRQFALFQHGGPRGGRGPLELAGWYVASFYGLGDDRSATVLRRSPWVAREWGRAPVAWDDIALIPRTREVEVGGTRVPMLQAADAGFGSAYLPILPVIPALPFEEPMAKRTIAPSDQPRTGEVVLVYYGSFAPFHRGHHETLVLARQTLEERGLRVLAAYVVPVQHLGAKDAELPSLRPWTIRAAVAQLAIADLEWASVASVTCCVENVARRLERRAGAAGGPAPATVWVNGADIEMTDYMRWLIDSIDQVDLLFMPRAGTGCPSAVASDRVIHSPLVPELALSSTAVRAAIHRGALAEAAHMMCNGASAAYMLWAHHEVDQMGRRLPM